MVSDEMVTDPLREALWAVAQGVREAIRNDSGPREESIALPFVVEQIINRAEHQIRALGATPTPRAERARDVIDINAPMPDGFREYVVTNYRPNTIIGNPEWHAPKLWGAAVRAMRDAARTEEASRG